MHLYTRWRVLPLIDQESSAWVRRIVGVKPYLHNYFIATLYNENYLIRLMYANCFRIISGVVQHQ